MRRTRARAWLAGVTAAAALSSLGATAAQAGPTGDPCGSTASLTQAFGRYGDKAWYAFWSDGGVEGGAAGWTLDGGAAVGTGNEAAFLHAASDAVSLSLPAGASATPPPICASNAYPTMRFMAQNRAPARPRSPSPPGTRT